MKKFFRILTVVQVVWQGYQWYKNRGKDKAKKQSNDYSTTA